METTYNTTIVAFFSDLGDANAAVAALHRIGFTSNEIGMSIQNTGSRPRAHHLEFCDRQSKLQRNQSKRIQIRSGFRSKWIRGFGEASLLPLPFAVPLAIKQSSIRHLNDCSTNPSTRSPIAMLISILAGSRDRQDRSTSRDAEARSDRIFVTVTSVGHLKAASAILQSYGAICRG